jgi:hypothetical protein
VRPNTVEPEDAPMKLGYVAPVFVAISAVAFAPGCSSGDSTTGTANQKEAAPPKIAPVTAPAASIDPITYGSCYCPGCDSGFGYSAPADYRCYALPSGQCAFCTEYPQPYSVYWSCTGC